MKKSAKIIELRTWCTKNLFGYRVAHFEHLLTSCLGHLLSKR